MKPLANVAPITETTTLAPNSLRMAINVLWNLLAYTASIAGGLLTSILATRSLPPGEYGLFSLVVWARLTMGLVLDIGLSSAMTKFVAELRGSGRPENANTFATWIIISQTLLAVLAGLSFVFGAPFLGVILGSPTISPYLPIAAGTLVLTMVNGVLVSHLQGHNRFDLKGIVFSTTAVLRIIGFSLVLPMELGIRGLLWVETIVSGFQFIILIGLHVRSGWSLSLRSGVGIETRRILKFCIGVFVVSTVDVIVWRRSEMFVLGRYARAEEIAYYNLAYTIATMALTTIPNALVSVMLPSLSERFGANDRAGLQSLFARATTVVALISFPALAGVVAVSTPLITILYGSSYEPASNLLRILVIGSVAGTIGATGSMLYLALSKPNVTLWWAVPLAVANLPLAFWLVPRYGATGAAIANSSCQVVFVMCALGYLAIAQGFRLPWRRFGRIALAALLVGSVAFVITEVLGGPIGLVLGILAGLMVYLPALRLTSALTRDDYPLIERCSNLPMVRRFPTLRKAIVEVGRFATQTT